MGVIKHVVDGGYLSWVYGPNAIGWSSWASAKIEYSKSADALIVMDSQASHRTEFYPKYKEQRATRRENKPERELAKKKVMDFRHVLREDHSINTCELVGNEADDLIAWLALFWDRDRGKMPVIGVDKDLVQLAHLIDMRDHTGTPHDIFRPLKKFPKRVHPYFKSYDDICFFLALMGDDSDSIQRLIPPYQLEIFEEIMSYPEPWYRAVQLLGFDLVARNLRLVILPGPWELDHELSDQELIKIVSNRTYLNYAREHPSKAVKKLLSSIVLR